MKCCFILAQRCALAFTIVMVGISGSAHAATVLYDPYITKGEFEVEYFGSATNDSNASKDNKQKHKFALGYGITNSWASEINGNFAKDAGDNVTFDNIEWENFFQLTEQGEYWVDVGASLAYEWTPRSNVADTIEARILLAKDVGKTSHIVNFIGEKNVGSGPRDALEGEILWSSRYRYLPYFEPGFEIFSEFGELKNTGSFNEQEHAIGPAAYGKIPLGLTQHADAIKYRVGHLFGVSDAAADGDTFLQLEYELHF